MMHNLIKGLGIFGIILLLSSCQLEPKEVKELSETKKQEILDRGYLIDSDFSGKVEKIVKENKINDDKNKEKNNNEKEESSSKDEVIEEIKKEYKKSEYKAILEIREEIEKIRKDEILKLEDSLKEYPNLRGDLLDRKSVV